MAQSATKSDEGTSGRPDEVTGAHSGRRTGLERDEIIATALALVERDGPAALTMRALAAELDVGTPTIYWHIASRDELIAEIIRAQSARLAEVPITGATARERVYAAARAIWSASIEHRALTSLAHQSGTSTLLIHPLEAALVRELESAGLTGQPCAQACRAIIATITGSLVLALRDVSKVPEAFRPDALWADPDVAISDETRAALCREGDLSTISASVLHAVIDHLVPDA